MVPHIRIKSKHPFQMLSIITAILAAAFSWCMLFGRMPLPFLIPVCVGLGALFVNFGVHRHAQTLPVDVLAQKSRLKCVNPKLKFWTLLALMVICVASRSVFTGAFLTVSILFLAVFAGGLSLHRYAHILALPTTFLLLGGLALLLEVSPEPIGVFNINVFGLWLSVTSKAQIQAALVISRAFGAVSCLCFLSITTPMPDIIGVLRKAHCPDIIIDLMYLTYRYIFILLSLHREMRDAAKSRLGFRDYRASLRATGKIYANLLARSYQFADRNFDAIESRCYDTGISFLERKSNVAAAHICVSAALLVASLCFSLMPNP